MNILITGASGGIGYQAALYLAVEGHTVFAIARRMEKLEQLQTEVQRQNPAANLYLLAGDISNADFLITVGNEITRAAGVLHVLINNAGKLVNKPFRDLTPSEWTEVYSTNLFGAVNLIRGALPLFSTTEKCHILNISSMGGFQGSAKFSGLSAYNSSKAAVVGLTECLAEEFKERNISVNCLCLGSVQTEMFAAAFPSFKAATTVEEAGRFVADFALNGAKLFNGKIIPVSSTTP